MKPSTNRDEEERAAWLLASLKRPPLRERGRLVLDGGSARAALASLAYPVAREAWDAADRAGALSRAAGAQTLCLADAGFPTLLSKIADPPLLLSVLGKLETADGIAIAVVGSRRASAYGLEMAFRVARELAERGVSIVSGLARGIDAAAHRGALEAGGRTIAVLGSGIAELYPREHRKLAERVARSGAVVSEFHPHEPPRARNFPRRNRIITGLALGTVVVEAAAKSGSLVSARLAMDQNREVYAVPGPALSPNSEGVHALIRDGARLSVCAQDVIDELRPEIRELLEPEAPKPARTLPPLDAAEALVLSYLRSEQQPRPLDPIVLQTGLPVDQTLAALCTLEVHGLVLSLAGGRYQVRP